MICPAKWCRNKTEGTRLEKPSVKRERVCAQRILLPALGAIENVKRFELRGECSLARTIRGFIVGDWRVKQRWSNISSKCHCCDHTSDVHEDEHRGCIALSPSRVRVTMVMHAVAALVTEWPRSLSFNSFTLTGVSARTCTRLVRIYWAVAMV